MELDLFLELKGTDLSIFQSPVYNFESILNIFYCSSSPPFLISLMIARYMTLPNLNLESEGDNIIKERLHMLLIIISLTKGMVLQTIHNCKARTDHFLPTRGRGEYFPSIFKRLLIFSAQRVNFF